MEWGFFLWSKHTLESAVREGAREAAVIRVSLLGVSAGFLVMLLARTFPGVLLTTGLFVLAVALLRPAVTALISKQTTGGQ